MMRRAECLGADQRAPLSGLGDDGVSVGGLRCVCVCVCGFSNEEEEEEEEEEPSMGRKRRGLRGAGAVAEMRGIGA